MAAASKKLVGLTRLEIAASLNRIAEAKPRVEQSRSVIDRTKVTLDAAAAIIRNGQADEMK
jgi:hypothetical protein